MEAGHTLQELKIVVNQNSDVKLVLAEAKQLVSKLEKEFKKLKDANEKVVITRVNRRGNEKIDRFFCDLNRDRSEEPKEGEREK